MKDSFFNKSLILSGSRTSFQVINGPNIAKIMFTILFYMLTVTLMTISNKALFHNYKFKSPVLVSRFKSSTLAD